MRIYNINSHRLIEIRNRCRELAIKLTIHKKIPYIMPITHDVMNFSRQLIEGFFLSTKNPLPPNISAGIVTKMNNGI